MHHTGGVCLGEDSDTQPHADILFQFCKSQLATGICRVHSVVLILRFAFIEI